MGKLQKKCYQSPGDEENEAESLTEGFLVRGDSLHQQPVADEGDVAGQPHRHLPGGGGRSLGGDLGVL